MARLLLALCIAVALWGSVLCSTGTIMATGTLTFKSATGGKTIPIPMLMAGSEISREHIDLYQDWNILPDDSKQVSFNITSHGMPSRTGNAWTLNFITTDTYFSPFYAQFSTYLYDVIRTGQTDSGATYSSNVLQCTKTGGIEPICFNAYQIQCSGSETLQGWPVNINFNTRISYCYQD